MPGNVSQKVTLQFQADTSAAKRNIDQLKKSLETIQSDANISLHLDADLNEAKKAAQELGAALQGAVNQNTGQLNFTAFNAQLKAAGTSVTELGQKLLLAGNNGQTAFNNLVSAVANSNTQIKQMNATLSTALTTLKNTIKWEASSTLVHGIESAFSSAISYATNLNKTLTDIRIVTGASIDDMTKFTREANQMARDLGSTTQDIAKASLIYYQQGDSAAMAAQKAAITTKAANVAFTASAQEMSEMLTAVWNSYQVGEGQLERVVDTMAALGATTASSTEEIATAMQKVAATANNVGVTINQMSSIIATAASVTRQAPEQVGTSWNTLLARMGSLKLGETLEDGVNLTKYTQALQSVGVQALDAGGQLKNMGQIINEVGEAWGKMTTTQREALAQTVGGVRQQTQMIAFFDNFDKYQKNLQTAENAGGTLDAQQAIYMTSYEAAAKQAQAAMEKLYSVLINDQGLTAMQKTMASITNSVADLAQGLGGLPGILATVSNLMSNLFSNSIATKATQIATSIASVFKSSAGAYGLQGLKENVKLGWQNLSARVTHQMTANEQKQFQELQVMRDTLIQPGIEDAKSQPNQVLQNELTLADQIIAKKQELLTLNSRLSQEEISQREKAINLATQELSQIAQKREAYEAAKNQQININTLSRGVLSETRDETYIAGLSNQRARAEASNYLNANRSQSTTNLMASFGFVGTSTIDNYAQVYEKANMATLGIQEFSRALQLNSTSMADTATKQQTLKNAFEGLESIFSEAGLESTQFKTKIDEIKQAFENFSNNGTDENLNKLQTALKNLQGSLNTGDLANALSANGQNTELIDQINQKIIIVVRNLMSAQTQSLSAGQALEQSFGDKVKTKLQSLGSTISKVVSGLSGMIATLSQTSSLVSNWDTSSLTSKITSIGSTITSIVTSKSLLEAGFKIGGTIIGGLIGAIEKGEREAAKRLKELKDKVSTGNSENNTQFNTYNEQIKSFEELYQQKQQGLDVDNQLITSAEQLGISYNTLYTSVGELSAQNDKLAESIYNVTAAQREQLNLAMQATVANAAKVVEDTNYGYKTEVAYVQPTITGQDIEAYLRNYFNTAEAGERSKHTEAEWEQLFIDYLRLISGNAYLDTEELSNGIIPRDYFDALAAQINAGQQEFGLGLEADYGNLTSINITAQEIAEFVRDETLANLAASNYSGYNSANSQLSLANSKFTVASVDAALAKGQDLYKIFRNSKAYEHGLIAESYGGSEGPLKGNFNYLLSAYDSAEYTMNAYDDLVALLNDLSIAGLQDTDVYTNLTDILSKMREPVEAYRIGLEQYHLFWASNTKIIHKLSGQNENTMSLMDFNTVFNTIQSEANDMTDNEEAYNTLISYVEKELTGYENYIAILKMLRETIQTQFADQPDVADQIYKTAVANIDRVLNTGDYSVTDFTESVIEQIITNNGEIEATAVKRELIKSQATNAAYQYTQKYSNLVNAQSKLKKNMSDSELYDFSKSLDWADYGFDNYNAFKAVYKTYAQQQAWLEQQRKEEVQKRLAELGNESDITSLVGQAKQEYTNAQNQVSRINPASIRQYQNAMEFGGKVYLDEKGKVKVADGAQINFGIQQKLLEAYSNTDNKQEWFNNYTSQQWDKLGLSEAYVNTLSYVQQANIQLQNAQNAYNTYVEELEKLGITLSQFGSDTLNKASVLQSAFSNLPSTADDMDQLLVLINKYQTDNKQEEYTAESLTNLFKTDQSNWQQLIINVLTSLHSEDNDAIIEQILTNMTNDMTNNKNETERSKKLSKWTEDVNKYKSQISSLQSAFTEFQEKGVLSQKTKSALEQLGIDPNSVKDLNTFNLAIKEAQTNLETTKNNLQAELTNNLPEDIIFNGETALLSWNKLKETYNLDSTYDDLENIFNAWKAAYWDAETAMDDFSAEGIIAANNLSKGHAQAQQALEKLTKTYQTLQSLASAVQSAFQNGEMLSPGLIAQIEKLTNITWNNGGTAAENLSSYGNILGQTAIANIQALNAQLYNTSNVATQYRTATGDISKLTAIEDSALKWAGGDFNLAQFIIDEVKKAKEAGTAISLKDIFDLADKENADILNQITGVWDDFTQSGISAVQSVLGEHQEAAQKVVDTWLNAFQAIAAAQITMSKGLSVSEDNDESTVSTLASQLIAQGYSPDEAYEILTSRPDDLNKGDRVGDIIAGLESTSIPIQDWAKGQGGALQFYYQNNGAAVTSGLGLLARAQEVLGNNLDKYMTPEIFNKAVENGIIKEGEKFDSDTQKQWARDALLDYYLGPDWRDPNKLNKIYQDAAGQVIGHQAAVHQEEITNAEAAVNAVFDSETYAKNQRDVETQNRVKSSVDAARDLLLKGESLESLTKEQQRDVLQATGATDLASVSISSLTGASDAAATSLLSLAAAAQGMFKDSAVAKGFILSEDGKTWTKDGQIDLDITNQWRELNENTRAAQDIVDSQDQNDLIAFAESVGYTTDEFRDLRDELMNSEGMSLNLKDDIDELNEITRQVANYKNGLDELQAISKSTWTKMRKDIKNGTADGRKNITSLKNSMAKTFNVDASKITSQFVKDHLDQLEKMSTGTSAEVRKAEETIQDDLVKEIIKADKTVKDHSIDVAVNADGVAETFAGVTEFFQNAFDQWDGEELGFTINADTAGAEANVITAMNNMLASGQMTAEGITAALNAIGWNPDIQYDEYEILSEDPVAGTITYQVPGIDGELKNVTGDASGLVVSNGKVRVPRIGKGGVTKVNGGGGKKQTQSSGGGGGGNKKKDKKTDADKERYHQIDRRISAQNSLLEKNNTLKERKYGKDYIDSLTKENELIQEQINLNKVKISEAEAYLAQDRAELEGYGATFDADGNLNYEAYMDSWIAWYNAKTEDYAAGKIDDDAWDEIEDKWDKAMKALENYEEAQDHVADLANGNLEKMNQISANNLEKITYKVEIRVDLNESDIKYIEYIKRKYEEFYDMQDETMGEIMKTASETEDTLSIIANGIAELDAQYAAGKITKADYMKQSLEYRNQMIDELNTWRDEKEAIEAVYGTALEKANEELQKHTRILQHVNSISKSYIEILGLMGYKMPYSQLEQFYNMQYDSNIKNLDVQKKHIDLLQEEVAYYEQKVAKGETLSETEQLQYERVMGEFIEAHDEFLSSTQDTLEGIKTMYEETLTEIWDDLSKINVAGHNDINELAESWSAWNEARQLYLSTGQQLYEVSKLNRDIEGSIADATTKASKERLAALQEVINAEAESGKLTEYNIEMYKLQYEMALAMQQLEEAQNAKSTVRLVRDENGNYGYQYTADENKIDEAQQNYEDVLERIRKLSEEYAEEMSKNLIDARKAMEDELRALDRAAFESEEEYQHAREEIVNRHLNVIHYYGEQYEIATQDQVTNLGYIGKHYGLTTQEVSNTTKEILNTDIKEMIDGQEYYEQSLELALQKADYAWKVYLGRIEEVKNTTNLSYEEMTKSVNTYTDAMKKQVEESDAVIKKTADTLTAIHDMTTAWDKHTASIKGTIEAYEKLLEQMGKTIEEGQGFTGEGNEGEPVEEPPTEESQEAEYKVGWNKNSTGWWYVHDDGTYTTNGWEKIDGNWYHFDDKGYMQVGWFKEDGNWYYLGTNGAMVIGQQTIDGKLHGFNDNGQWTGEIVADTNTDTSGGTSQGWHVEGLTDIYGSKQLAENARNAKIEELTQVNTTEAMKQIRDLKNAQIRYYRYGGIADFTGPAWLDGTKTDPELVLNPDDTSNMLAAIKVVRALTPQILSMFAANVPSMLYSDIYSPGVHNSGTQELQQNVQITAEFPNVSDRNEIEMAFSDLINQTAQYISRR